MRRTDLNATSADLPLHFFEVVHVFHPHVESPLHHVVKRIHESPFKGTTNSTELCLHKVFIYSSWSGETFFGDDEDIQSKLHIILFIRSLSQACDILIRKVVELGDMLIREFVSVEVLQ